MTPSSTSNQKSNSLKNSRGSFVSSEFQDSVISKVAEWKPFFNFQSFQEKQRSVHVSKTELQLNELHEELKRIKEERSHALENFAELKKASGKSMQGIDKIRRMELQAEKAMESEKKMLESMVHQTKELEQTKISLEEAKLEIRNLQESIRMMEDLAGKSHRSLDNGESLEYVGAQQEMMKLRNDLRLALEAEEKSKKAMDDLAVALKEVTTDTNQVKVELALRQSKLEKTREEAASQNTLLKIAEQKLLEALEEYDKMKLENGETVTAWMKKEDYLLNCLRVSEEGLTEEKQENSRVNKALRAAREESSKLRDIIKQAVNEASMVREALEIAQIENSQLKNQLFEKENSLQQARQDYESLKVSEAAALDCVKELKSLFASTSATDSKKSSNFTDVGSSRISKGTVHSAKSNMCLKIFPSERCKPDYSLVNNGRRRSMGEPEIFKGSLFDKEGTNETKKMFSSQTSVSDVRVPLFIKESESLNLYESDVQFPDTVNGSLKKKKTILGKLGNTLRRRSIHN